jgi:hypothetical protein
VPETRKNKKEFPMNKLAKKVKNPLLAAGLSVAATVSQAAFADQILLGVFAGNDGINSDGSTQLEALLSTNGIVINDVDALGVVNWVFDADGDSSNGNQLVNPQGDNGFIIEGTVFKPIPDSTEAVAGTWEWTGPEFIDFFTIKFDGYVAVYQVTGGMTSGNWSTEELCLDHGFCSGPAHNQQPFAMSHMSSYTSVEVPLPATAWLFGSALLGMAGLKRKK